MSAIRILGCLSVVFLSLASWRTVREHQVGPAARTWFIIGAIFALVSFVSWLGGMG